MSNNQEDKLTDRELRQLLGKIELLAKEEIRPLSDKEVDEIEAVYQPRTFSAEREARHRQQLEELREGWLSDVSEIEGIFSKATEVGVSREKLARQLRLTLDVLLKLDLHLIVDSPLRLSRKLAEVLDVDIRSVVSYLTQRSTELEQMAASSQDRPAAGRPQTWEGAILSSNMSEEDKEYWFRDAS